MSLRYLTKAKKEARRQKNGDAVNAIYDRGKSLIPADYLICHQPSTPANVRDPVLALLIEHARGNPPKLISRVARFYPTTGPNRIAGRFKDLRGIPYEVTESGAIVRVKIDVPA
jgi:hypothetical protein